jgi:hypothetical protein
MKRKNIPLIISLVLSVVTAFVYFIFYLIDHIPTISKITLFNRTDPPVLQLIDLTKLPMQYQLPFEISRLWDILFVFIFTFIILKLINIHSKNYKEDEEGGCFYTVHSIGPAMGVGLLIGEIGLVIGIIFILLLNLMTKFIIWNKQGFKFGLISCIISNFIFGFCMGAIIGFGIGFLISIITSIICIILNMLIFDIWFNIGNFWKKSS